MKPQTLDGYRNRSAVAEAEAAEILSRYQNEIVSPGRVYGTGVVRAWRNAVPQSVRTPVRCLVTDVLSIRERRRVRRLEGSSPLQLHLGSGDRYRDGWINVDLVGHRVDVTWNLNRPLPFEDGTVDAIFHEHVLEHLRLLRGISLLSECCRVLRSGGILRIGVPDAGAYIRSYCEDPRGFLEAMRPGRPTSLLALQEEFYWHGHRTMYDFETLSLVCEAAGFTGVERRVFGDSRLQPAPDSRPGDTLYVEAVR